MKRKPYNSRRRDRNSQSIRGGRFSAKSKRKLCLGGSQTIQSPPILKAYRVELLPVNSIKPSPENDLIYGPVRDDDQMDALITSIRDGMLEEPLIVSADDYIISGHRRFRAILRLGWTKVPVRRKPYSRASHLEQWPSTLAALNPQRVKSPGSMLREVLPQE